MVSDRDLACSSLYPRVVCQSTVLVLLPCGGVCVRRVHTGAGKTVRHHVLHETSLFCAVADAMPNKLLLGHFWSS